MSTELATRPADMFSLNKMGMFSVTPDQESAPAAQARVSLGSAFERAIKIESPEPAAAPISGISSSKIDSVEIADRARIAGDALQSAGQGIHLQEPAKGDIGYVGGQALKLGSEVGQQAWKLGGELISGLFGSVKDKGAEGPALHDDDMKTPAPVMFPPSGMPSPGMG